MKTPVCAKTRGPAARAGLSGKELSGPLKKENPCALISVYLALVLLIITGLIFTITESARVSAAKARLGSISYMAADSVFSSFAEPIFEDYGVMMLWSDQSSLENSFRSYAEGNLEISAAASLFFTDLCQMSFNEVSVSDIARPADDGGSVFAEQVLEYMEYSLAEDALEDVLDGISVFEQTEAVTNFMEKINEKQEIFANMEAAALAVSEVTQKAASADDPSEYLSAAGSALEEYTAAGSSSAAKAFSSALSSLTSSVLELTGCLEDINTASADYYECAQEADEAADQLEAELEAEIEDLDGDIYEALLSQIEELRQMSADTDYDYFGVSECDKTASGYLELLSSLDTLFEGTKEDLSEENAEDYYSLVSEYTAVLEELDLSALKVDLDTQETEAADSSFLTSVSSLFSEGFLALVAEDVSESVVSTDAFPSLTESSEDPGTDESLIDAAYSKALFCEYVLQYFGNYTDANDTSALSYEAEYIIAGEDADSENLASVTKKIALIRSGLNFISLLKDSEKTAEAEALAAAIAGVTGLPVLTKVFELLILNAWAMAEAVCDVKALLSGKKVETIKSSGSWNISLSALQNFSQDTVTVSSSDSGLGYASYLRVLLLMKNDSTLYLRTLDMIQANMCANENADFLISECVTSAIFEAEYEVPYLFLSFLFARKLSGATGTSYTVTTSTIYGY